MKCRYCGYNIPEGELRCKKCGHEVQIVPDYNPLEDMLEEQIKAGVNGGPRMETGDLYDVAANISRNTGPRKRTTGNMRNTTARRTTGRTAGQNTTARRNTSAGRNASAGRNTSARRNTQTGRGVTARMTEAERENRRRQAERKKAALRKKRRKLLLVMFLIIAAVGGIVFFFYWNSYSGMVGRGNRAFEKQEYENAAALYEKAISSDKSRPEAYTGLADVYIKQDQTEEAGQLFADALEKQAGNSDLYEAYIHFFMKTDQQMEIPLLLDDAKDSVREELAEYIVDVPSYDLDEEEIYDDVQQLKLSSSEKTIYYTTDGSDPTFSSTKYTEPIQLDEGENVIKSIAVNKQGIPSMVEEKTYTIEFPVEDAPAVSPSTGQYESAEQIEVKVPDGYDAYYTMDGEDPTTASTRYTGPIDMPEGETLFKVVLVDQGGRMSGITTRNYMLESSGE